MNNSNIKVMLIFKKCLSPCRHKRLNELLKHEKLFTFAGFSIESDKEKLKLSGLEINPNKFIDIQRK